MKTADASDETIYLTEADSVPGDPDITRATIVVLTEAIVRLAECVDALRRERLRGRLLRMPSASALVH